MNSDVPRFHYKVTEIQNQNNGESISLWYQLLLILLEL